MSKRVPAQLLAGIAVVFDTGAVRCKVDGFSNFGEIANVHPYTAIVSAALGFLLPGVTGRLLNTFNL